MKRYLIAALLLAPVLAFSAGAEDCKSPKYTAEVNQCAASEFKEQDRKLNEEYSALIGNAKEKPAAYPKEFYDAILNSQRAWLKYRDSTCAVEAMYVPDDVGIQSTVRNDCLARVTAQRVKELSSWRTSRFD